MTKILRKFIQLIVFSLVPIVALHFDLISWKIFKESLSASYYPEFLFFGFFALLLILWLLWGIIKKDILNLFSDTLATIRSFFDVFLSVYVAVLYFMIRYELKTFKGKDLLSLGVGFILFFAVAILIEYVTDHLKAHKHFTKQVKVLLFIILFLIPLYLIKHGMP